MFGTSQIKQYQQVIESNGFDQVAHYRLASEYLKAGRYMEAAAKYRRAVELNPESIDAWRGLGEAYRLAGVEKEAEAAWRTALGVARRLGNTQAARELEDLYRTVNGTAQ